MARVAESRIRVAVRSLATDAELCKMFGVTPEQLEPYRAAIEQTRAQAMAILKYQRAMVQASRPPRIANKPE